MSHERVNLTPTSIQGLYNLAQMEEENADNGTVPLRVWSQLGLRFDEKIVTSRYRRLQSIYHLYEPFAIR